MKFLADAFWFERAFAAIERLKDRQRGANQIVVGENAAQSDRSFLGMNCDQRVDAIFGLQLIAPASFRGGTAKAGAANFTNFHSGELAPVAGALKNFRHRREAHFGVERKDWPAAPRVSETAQIGTS